MDGLRNSRNGMLVHSLLDAAVEGSPDSPAVRDARGRWTYGELDGYSHAAAAWLAGRGVAAGDRVVAQWPTSRELVALTYGASRLGAVFVPLNPNMKEFHRASVVENAEPVLVLSGADRESAWQEIERLRADGARAEPAAIAPSDLAFLIYTSGSTAAPKGVMGPHAEVVFATGALVDALGYRPDDVVFCRFPMSWDYGLYKVLMCAASGAEIVLADGESDLVLLGRIREVGATIVPIVPSLASMICTLADRDPAPRGSSRVRMFTNTGAALPAGVIAKLRDAFPGTRVVRQFGQTECKRISVMPPDRDRERPDAVGLPLPGTRVLILDADGGQLPAGAVGEIVVEGPHVMPGYWRNPELTAKSFRRDPATGVLRLHTGDYGHLDTDGYLYFEGRRDDMFKRKGIRMSVLEIEAAALDVPGVRAAAAIPPEGERDLVIFADTDLAPTTVLRELAARLEPAKVPALCRVVDEIPLTLHGKNATRELAARLARHSAEPDPAAAYGTPRYVYDLDDVTAARDALLAQLPDEFDVFYALKANPHPDVAAAVRAGAEDRVRAEISSVGELRAALAAGYAADRAMYTGPGKTRDELDEAVGRGVRLFSVESPGDLRHVGAAALRHGVVAECLLRINTTESGASTGVRMMGKPSQFGLDAETLPELMPVLTSVPGTRVIGAHFFTMSNAREEDGLLDEYARVVELVARLAAEDGLPLEFLDIGGGFASPYAVPGERAEYRKLRAGLEQLLDLHLPRWRAGTPNLSCESGRYLVGGSGALVSRVVNVKQSRGRGFVILDAGINAVGGLSGLGRLLPMAAEVEAGQASTTASLVGPLCTPGDTLGRDVALPDLAAGDTVTIPNVGAYGATASLLGFLGRPAPVEVAVRGGRVVSASRLELGRTAVRPAAGAASTAQASPTQPDRP